MAERGETVEELAVRDASAGYSVKPGIARAEDVPLGYKRTELGVIPEDWYVVSIGELARTYSGGTPSTARPEYYGGDVPWITSSDLNRRTLRNVEGRITKKGLEKSSAKMVEAGTLIIALYGATAGVSAIANIRASINQAVLAVVTRSYDTKLLLNILSFNRDEYVEKLTQGGQPNLSGALVRSIKVPVPPIEEQRAIATALSDADALIESLDRLITKKRAIKQAAMQQLLTGQVRLLGFTGEWETKRLGDVGTFYKGQGIQRDDVSDEGVPCIRYGEIYTRYGDCVLKPVSRIPEAVAEAAFPLRTGDILFAGSGETAEEIGMCVAYLGEQPAFAGGDIVVLRPNEGVSSYLGRLLNHPTIAQQKARLGQGDAVVHISARNLAQIEVHLPKQEEQTAIATVLSDIDTEIEALERRRDKARQIKQGMMQQLLTGRVRLVEATSPARVWT